MKRKKKECVVVARQICERLGEDLHSRRCASIRKHISECEDCFGYLKGLEQVISLYRQYPVPPLSPRALGEVRTIIKKT